MKVMSFLAFDALYEGRVHLLNAKKCEDSLKVVC